MLVLSRRSQDSIHFPELNISIEFLQIQGKTVKVGVRADREVTILRGEIVETTNEHPGIGQHIASS